MVRKITELAQDTPDLQIRARIGDTYTKPATEDEGSLEKIMRSLVGFNPKLKEFLDNKAEEKKDFDLNRGAALYNMMGEDMPWEDAKKKLIAGDISGYKDITTNLRNGYLQERHKTVGLKMYGELRAWENQGVGIDKDGKQVALSSIEDPNELLDIFNRKKAEIMKSYIGDSFDPKYYGEYIQPAVDRATKEFVAKQSETRAAVLLDQRERAFGESLNSYMGLMIENNELLLEDTAITPQIMAEGLKTLCTDAMAGGMNETVVYKELTTMLRSMMYDYDIDNIDGLKEVAKLLPIWNDPTYRGIIESGAKSAVTAKRQIDNAKREQQKQEAHDAIGAAFGTMLDKYDYDPAAIPAAEWTALMKIAPKTLDSVGWISTAQAAFENVHSRSVAQERGMSDDEFYRTYGEFATGRKGLGSLFSYVGKTTPQQYKELVGGYNLHQSVVKASGGNSTSKANNAYTKTKATALKMLTTGDGNKALDYNDAVLFDGMSSKISYEALQLHAAWKKKNPDASPIEQQIALEGFTRDRVKAYGGNIETYREQPDTLNSPPQQIRHYKALRDSASILQGLPQGNPTIEATCRRISEAVRKGNAVTFSPEDLKTLNQALRKTGYKGRADSLIKELVRLEKEMQAPQGAA